MSSPGFRRSLRWKTKSAKLNQAFLNLARNAVQAAGPEGQVTEPSRCTSPGIEVLVSDSGDGISEEVVHNALTPFFTTRATGEGTGLGLSMALGAVEEHGERIDIDSAVGVGSTITVVLPKVQQQAARAWAYAAGLSISGEAGRVWAGSGPIRPPARSRRGVGSGASRFG
ncbi:MAG: HAMP domain-containing sensor histidine kinase [Pseudomonadota bacterium]